MTETSWWWDGHTTGDAAAQAPYERDQWAAIYSRLYTPEIFKQGVIGGTLNSLAVTASSASSVTVASGAAIVYGKLYYSDAPINFPVSGESVYWLIGLVMNKDAQNVRAFSRGGYTDEASAMASLVTLTSYWEIPLAIVFTQTNGTIQTIIDKRLFVLRPEKEKVFVPATGCYNLTDTLDVLKTGNPGPEGYYLEYGKYVSSYGNFLVPNNFWKLLTVKSVVVNLDSVTVNIYSKTYVEYGAFYDVNSEVYNAHIVSQGFKVSPIAGSYSCLVNTTPEISDLARGQYNNVGYENEFLCLTFSIDGTNASYPGGIAMYFLGWLVEYAVLF